MIQNQDIVSTGIGTLDNISEGGFKIGTHVIVAGQPGAGKTTLGLQFLYHGAKIGEPGVYASLLESSDVLRSQANRFGWDFQKLATKVEIMDLIPTVKEKGASETLNDILGAVRKLNAKRLVVDSLTVLTSYIETRAEARSFIAIMGKFLRNLNCTTISFVEVPWGKKELGSGFEEFLGDSLIVLESAVDDYRVRRRLFIPKMREANHALEAYDFFITNDGIRLSAIPAPARGTQH